MPRPSQRMQKCIHIDLSSIKYDSTCVTLNMPLEFACDNCKSKIESKIGISKKSSNVSKRLRHFKHDRWRCQQLWQSKYGDKTQTTATVRKHIWTQNYLNIKQDVKIDYTSHQYKNIKKKETDLNYKTNNITSAPIDEPSLYATDKKQLPNPRPPSRRSNHWLPCQKGLKVWIKNAAAAQSFIPRTIRPSLTWQPALTKGTNSFKKLSEQSSKTWSTLL